MNAAVLAAGGGYGPKRTEEWTEAIDCLLNHEAIARRMAQQGREAVVNSYSLEALAPRLARVLESIGKQG
jgi:glycosyltransferase involved in cell wall biosynthesis